jgi:hypothetical protein
MDQPITADGKTNLVTFEHVSRVIEIRQIPIAGWIEWTGGGVKREGGVLVYGAGDEPRDRTDGRAVPQDMDATIEPYTWYAVVKPYLILDAQARGDRSATGYMKVPFVVVDQWRNPNPLGQNLTTRHHFKITEDMQETPKAGDNFTKKLKLGPVTLPEEIWE